MGRFWQLKFRLELREEDRPSLAQALALTLALSLTLALALALAFALALALAQASALALSFCSDLITKREALLEESRGPTILWKFQKGSECIYLNEQGQGCRSPKKLEKFSWTPVMDWRANCQRRKRTFDGDELLQKSVT